jgi:hypothetical protein
MDSTLTIKTHVWSAISPITNRLHIGHSEPTLEQAFWKGFEYCGEFRNYTLQSMEIPENRIKNYLYENPEGLPFRILWTDADDHLLEKYVATAQEAEEIIETIKTSVAWNEMKEMLELLEFKMW